MEIKKRKNSEFENQGFSINKLTKNRIMEMLNVAKKKSHYKQFDLVLDKYTKILIEKVMDF